MADQSGSAHIHELFESALQAYEDKAVVTLAEHPLAIQLQSCDTAESITAVLQGQLKVFSEFRRGEIGVESIKNTISILTKISDAATFAVGIGLQFPPVKAIYVGLAILLAAANSVMDSYDSLVDLLESIEHFLCRLDIYTKIPPTAAMDEILAKILVELISTLALATRELKQGRSIKSVKELFGEKDIKAVLQRLGRLTQDEAKTTAAEILKVIYSLVQNMRGIMNNDEVSIDDIMGALEILHEMASAKNKSKRDELQRCLQSWLSPPDPWRNHNIAHDLRHSGTGTWFIQCNTLSEWKESGASSLLWIHGRPGTGKSVLCSNIIQDIKALRKCGLASLAFYHHDFREKEKKNVRGLLSSVLFQLCSQCDSYDGTLSKFYSTHHFGFQYPSNDELVRCLKELLEMPGQAPVYLIIDALEECPATSAMPSSREEVLALVEQLVKSRLTNLRLCVTSRLEADIKTVLDPLTFRSISIHSERGQLEDIESYVRSFINSDPKNQGWKEEDKQLVTRVLTERANGIFRWAYCQLVRLQGCHPGHIRHTLAELPETLDETYERNLREISDANWELAHRLFQCITVAFRPLRVKELVDILAFDFNEGPMPKFCEDWRVEDRLQEVLSTCSTLISLVDTDNSGDSSVIQFSHSSVKEFLTSSRLADNRDTITRRYHVSMTPANALVAQGCLGILLHLDESITRDSLMKFPLTEYAAEHWIEHARFEGVSECAGEGMKRLFDASKPHFAIWLWIYDPIRNQSHIYNPVEREFQEPEPERTEMPLPPRGNPLHYAAFCGLHTVVKFLIDAHPQDVHSHGLGDKSTPLHLASIKGHTEVAQLLVEYGADVTAQSKYVETPLHRASQGGHIELSRFLVEHGADIIARDAAGWTPLHHASQQDSGNVDFARFLVDNGADVMARDERGETPLHRASEYGHVDLAQFLVERGADATAQSNHVANPLHPASLHGHLDLARFLVEHGVDVTSQEKDGQTPLHMASQYCRIDLARFLIERGADVTARDVYGRTSLHVMSIRGHVEFARFLIEHGADATAPDQFGGTPLHHLSLFGHLDLARLLVEHGADATARDEKGWTPLHGASRNGNVDFISFLFEHSADVAARDNNGFTPLHGASEFGNLGAAQFLIEHGADVTVKDKHGETPLLKASSYGHLSVARYLVEHGADVTTRDAHRKTPLHRASVDGHLDFARFLVENGADATAQDERGETPLHLASAGRHLDLARFLVEHGADTTTRDMDGSTPLHKTLQCHCVQAARFHIENGADAKAWDRDGPTPLHQASHCNSLAFAQFLVEHGADVTASDKDGSTPLHRASEYDHVDLARFLVQHGANVTVGDKDGSTPLHMASRSLLGGVDLARLLVEHGADVRARDKEGSTPLYLASQAGHVNLARFLVEHGPDATAQVSQQVQQPRA